MIGKCEKRLKIYYGERKPLLLRETLFLKQRTLRPDQTLELANLSSKAYRSSKGLAVCEKGLEKLADYLLDVGPGKKPDGLRKNPPAKEVLLSSDFISNVVRPAMMARQIG